MTDLVPPTGRVHWIGTGLSTGSGLGVLASSHDVVLWARTEEKAERCLAGLGLTGKAGVRRFGHDALAAELRAGDVVVSMLPAPEHPALVRLCLDRSAHFACSSYASDELVALGQDAADRGVVVLTEAGLDPGIDHLYAHLLVERAKAEIGADTPASAVFTSYCGGLPAEPNEFRYRFSWAPRSVLTALRTAARYVENGRERVAERPWEATRPQTVNGETFEVYPNRDSVPFIGQYQVPGAWRLETFVRGTVRLHGWRRAWSEVFAVLREDDDDRVTALAGELAEKYPMNDDDLDRVVLSVALTLETEDGRRWSGEYVLDLVGDREETAMARTVSVTLACGVADLLAGRTEPGLHRATAESAARWLDFLSQHGVRSELRVPASSST
ncbi:saccharopine dehydrogenase family protein [Lentzea sp. NPDC004782]|uniref:saccharopine dehydrogenase family protein n=1 Tax=Lentzea sp. NPDC004782 TaxID=3154458 RepID=UPI0033B43BC8